MVARRHLALEVRASLNAAMVGRRDACTQPFCPQMSSMGGGHWDTICDRAKFSLRAGVLLREDLQHIAGGALR